MLAANPPMGWNSWDCYGASVDENTVRQNAAYMAEHLKPYGWEYIVVDIQWYQPTAKTHEYEPFAPLHMDANGRLYPAVNRFPSSADGAGFKPLADYVHSLGLKFGIHIMRGLPRMAAHNHLPIADSSLNCAQAALSQSVCQWNPDMYGLRCSEEIRGENPGRAYYASIFRLYAQWGVDFVKCDDIAREYPQCEKEIEIISEACRHCGRDIVLSLSPGPAPVERAEHLKAYANMWRITDDFWDQWDLLRKMFERAEKWCIHAGPGHWPDADMLPLGALRLDYSQDDWTHFTPDEQKTMMTLWCMMRSPLMLGCEMTKLDEPTLALITNRDVLDIEKTTYCGHPLYTTDTASLWIAPERCGNGLYVALFNLSDCALQGCVTEDSLERPVTRARELWTGQSCSGSLQAHIAPHGCCVWRIE